MDISEHRALVIDEHLSKICISHIESSNLVYIMTEDDYERAIHLSEAMKYSETINDQELFKYRDFFVYKFEYFFGDNLKTDGKSFMYGKK